MGMVKKVDTVQKQSIGPEILAMEDVPEAEIPGYMLKIQDHPSYCRFDQDVREHLHILQFPCHNVWTIFICCFDWKTQLL